MTKHAVSPLIIRSIQGEAIERPPVWMMRQAGRYLSEYRELKSRHTFLEMTKSAELALEVSLQPISILDVDAAIVFADILTPAEALGFEIDFNPGPVVRNPVKTPSDVTALALHNESQVYRPVLETLSGLRREMLPLNKGVIGFAGAPYTMACYLIEQGPIKHFQGTEIFAEQHPSAFESFLTKLTEMTVGYVEAQVEAGAQIVQIFDSWGGNLSADAWERWSRPSLERICAAIRAKGAYSALYLQPATHLLGSLPDVDILSVEWRVPLSVAEEALPQSTLQGNLSPTALYGDVEQEVHSMLSGLSRKTRYIANLGHGILQTTPRENALKFVDTIKGIRW